MYLDNQWKYFAVMNRNLAPGQGMNVLAHGVNALANHLRESREIQFANYQNAAGRSLGELSVWPYIVLESSSSEKLKTAQKQLLELKIPCIEFHASMLAASNEEQLAQTRAIAEGEGELYGIFTFGPTELLQPIMKRFSIFKGFRGGAVDASAVVVPTEREPNGVTGREAS